MIHYVTLCWSASIFRSCGWFFQQWWEDVPFCLLDVTDSLEFLVCRSCWPKHAEAEKWWQFESWASQHHCPKCAYRWLKWVRWIPLQGSDQLGMFHPRHQKPKESNNSLIELGASTNCCLVHHAPCITMLSMLVRRCWTSSNVPKWPMPTEKSTRPSTGGSHFGWPLPPWRKCGDQARRNHKKPKHPKLTKKMMRKVCNVKICKGSNRFQDVFRWSHHLRDRDISVKEGPRIWLYVLNRKPQWLSWSEGRDQSAVLQSFWIPSNNSMARDAKWFWKAFAYQSQIMLVSVISELSDS